jgi:hypothetical protein
MFSHQHNQRRRGRNRFCPERGREWHNVHTCNKCKNDKIKGEKKEKKN